MFGLKEIVGFVLSLKLLDMTLTIIDLLKKFLVR